MKTWWYERSGRERLILSASMVILLLLLAYVLVWQPLQADLQRLRGGVAQLRSDLAWMQIAAAEVKALEQNTVVQPPSAAAPSLLTLVDQTAKKAGFAQAIKRLEPQQDNQLRVQLEQVGFDPLLLWLGMLAREHSVLSVSVVINRAPNASGRVDARLILQRSL